MVAFDVDGDGDSDVVSTFQAHGWRIGWYEQIPGPSGPRFEEHLITPAGPPGANDPVVFEPVLGPRARG